MLRQPDALVRPLVLVSRSTGAGVVWLAALSFSPARVARRGA
ncbi:hypothetical protein ACU686_18660 [Yinghuangia aomiensis]